ncbi:MAG TPA: hypothetical protein VGP70_07355 [Actinomadura sp.]|nr:hypothetical protein [Actinomadura sp.]
MTARYAKALSPGATTQIEISATSPSDLTNVRARLRPVGSPTVYQWVDGFELFSGSRQDGVWRSAAPVTVEQGRYEIDVELTNDTRTVISAARGVIDRIIDNGLDSALTEASLSPANVDIEHPDATFRGRLVHRDPDGVERGVAGASVRFRAPGDYESESTTGADGRFEGPTSLRWTGDGQILFAGDATYRPANSELLPVKLEHLPTRLTVKAPPSGPRVVGEQVTVTGQLERKSREGVWGPLPNKFVSVELHHDYPFQVTRFGTVRTGPDGSYTASGPLPARGVWYVRFVPVNEDIWNPKGYDTAEAHHDGPLGAKYPSSITGFDIGPEPVGKGAVLTARGRVMRKMGDGSLAGGAQADVYLHFSTDGKKWAYAATASTDDEGYFTMKTSAQRDGHWRAVVDEYAAYLASNSAADYVDVKYRTSISSFNASPEPVAKGRTITVGGKLNRYVSSWGALGGKTVYVYFRPYGSKTASYMGVAGSDRYGNWKKGFKAVQDGTWMAKYKGDGTYLPADSASDYVDVR